jgi:hypothetical protein
MGHGSGGIGSPDVEVDGPCGASQKALDGVVLEDLVEGLAALARQVEQPLPNRSADVGDRPPCQCSASR